MEKREKGRARRWLIRLCSAALVALMVLPVLPNAVVLPASAVTQAEINQMKEDAAALKKQRAELQKQLKAIQADKSKALDQKALLEQQINATQAEINNIAAQITQYDQLIAQKETELAATEEKERAQYELFCKRVREMEEQGEVSYWSILFSSDDFSDLLDNAMMVEEIMDYDNQVMNELIAIREQIEADKTALETARQEQKDAKAEQEAAKAELKSQQSQVDALITEISGQESQVKAAEAKLQAAAKAMDNEIARKERELQAQLAREGIGPLLEELRQVDPEAAERLHPADEKRILRALEVYRETGKTISAHNAETRDLPPRYDAVWIGLQFRDRADMKTLIDRRVDAMVAAGLLEEVGQLLESGLPREATALQAIGYKEFLGVLDGTATVEEAVAEVKLRSRQYAKRQLTWLRRNPDIHWIWWEKDRDFARALQVSTEILAAAGVF